MSRTPWACSILKRWCEWIPIIPTQILDRSVSHNEIRTKKNFRKPSSPRPTFGPSGGTRSTSGGPTGRARAARGCAGDSGWVRRTWRAGGGNNDGGTAWNASRHKLSNIRCFLMDWPIFSLGWGGRGFGKIIWLTSEGGSKNIRLTRGGASIGPSDVCRFSVINCNFFDILKSH